MDEGLLLARLALGLLMAAHGAQKLFGWFGGHGLDGTAGFLDALGFRPGRLFAATAAASEVASGLLVAAGLAMTNGIELPLLYGIVAAALALTGPGAYSADAALGLTALWTPAITWTVLLLAVAGGVGNLALRRPVAQTA
jgi:putative oxidoreductase